MSAALEAAERGFGEWSARSAEERAQALHGAAGRLRERRLELAALQVRECAKPWPEADADVCEAIDFLEYYALEAVELDRGRALLQVPGERNDALRPARHTAVMAGTFPGLAANDRGRLRCHAALLKPASSRRARAAMVGPSTAGVPHDALALRRPRLDRGVSRARGASSYRLTSRRWPRILRVAAETPDEQGT